MSDTPPQDRKLLLDETLLLLLRRLQVARHDLLVAQQVEAAARERVAKLELAVELLDDPDFNSVDRRRPMGGPMQKELIVETLTRSAAPLSVRQIRVSIIERHDLDIPKISASPMLAKLEHAGVVEHVGSTWRLKDA